jgi:hypothetical protein
MGDEGGWHDGDVDFSMMREGRDTVFTAKWVATLHVPVTPCLPQIKAILARNRHDGPSAQRQTIQTICTAIHHIEAKTV